MLLALLLPVAIVEGSLNELYANERDLLQIYLDESYYLRNRAVKEGGMVYFQFLIADFGPYAKPQSVKRIDQQLERKVTVNITLEGKHLSPGTSGIPKDVELTFRKPAGEYYYSAKYSVRTYDNEVFVSGDFVTLTLNDDPGDPKTYSVKFARESPRVESLRYVQKVYVDDNDPGKFSISAVKKSVVEGEPVQFKLETTTTSPHARSFSVIVYQAQHYLENYNPKNIVSKVKFLNDSFINSSRKGMRLEVELPPDELSVPVELNTVDDNTPEFNGTVTVKISDRRIRIDNLRSIATVMVMDNDTLVTSISRDFPIVVSIRSKKLGYVEGSDVVFELFANSEPSESIPIKLNFGIPSDFVDFGPSTVVDLERGQRSKSIVIPTVDDSVDEFDGTIVVDIERDSGYEISPKYGRAIARVFDNDVPTISVFAMTPTVIRGQVARFRITSDIISNRNLVISRSSRSGYIFFPKGLLEMEYRVDSSKFRKVHEEYSLGLSKNYGLNYKVSEKFGIATVKIIDLDEDQSVSSKVAEVGRFGEIPKLSLSVNSYYPLTRWGYRDDVVPFAALITANERVEQNLDVKLRLTGTRDFWGGDYGYEDDYGDEVAFCDGFPSHMISFDYVDQKLTRFSSQDEYGFVFPRNAVRCIIFMLPTQRTNGVLESHFRVTGELLPGEGYTISERFKVDSLVVRDWDGIIRDWDEWGDSSELDNLVSIEPVQRSIVEGNHAVFKVSLFESIGPHSVESRISRFKFGINIKVTEYGDYLYDTAVETMDVDYDDFVWDQRKEYFYTWFKLRTVNDSIDEPMGHIEVQLLPGERYMVEKAKESAFVLVLDNDGGEDNSIPEISITTSQMKKDRLEEGELASFKIISSKLHGNPIYVLYNIEVSGDFLHHDKYTGEFRFPELTMSATLDLETLDDNVDEPDGKISVRLIPGIGYHLAQQPNDKATVDVLDNDALPVISISAENAQVVEGGTAKFLLESNGMKSSKDIEIRIKTLDIVGEFLDSPLPKSIILSANSVESKLSVDTVDDGKVDADGYITVVIEPGSDYEISESTGVSATVHVIDNDVEVGSTRPVVSISTSKNMVIEGETIEFKIHSSQSLLHDLVVNVEVRETGETFLGTVPEHVILKTGENLVSLLVETQDDNQNEVSSRISATLKSNGNYELSDKIDNFAFVDVIDNDQIRVSARFVSVNNYPQIPPWNGLWTDGLPLLVYFETIVGNTVLSRNLSINFAIDDEGGRLVKPFPATVELEASSDSVELRLSTVCNQHIRPEHEISLKLLPGDGYTVQHETGSATTNLHLTSKSGHRLDSCPNSNEISVSSADREVVEGETIEFAISAEHPQATNRIVNVLIESESGGKLTNSELQTVQILAGSQTINLLVHALIHAVESEVGTITVRVVEGVGYVVGATGISHVTVVRKDSEKPIASISSKSENIEEGDQIVFVVSLNRDLHMWESISIYVQWSAQGDFLTESGQTGVVAIQPELKETELSFETLDDATIEPNGHLIGTLVEGSEYIRNPTKNSDVVTVLDNDSKNFHQVSSILHREVLPVLLGFSSVQTIGSLAERIEFATNNSTETNVVIRGANNLKEMIVSSGEVINLGDNDLKDVLSNSSFSVQVDTKDVIGVTTSLWGNGHADNVFANGNQELLDWQGESFTGQIGLDAQIGTTLLLGIATSRNENFVDFSYQSEGTDYSGNYSIQMSNVQPYLAWISQNQSTNLYGSFSYGTGKVFLEFENEPEEFSKSDLYLAVVGANNRIFDSDDMFGGSGKLSIKSELISARQIVEQNEENIVGAMVNTNNAKIVVENSIRWGSDTDGVIHQGLSFGTHLGGREGNYDTGFELNGRVEYENPIGMNVSGVGIVSNVNDLDDWKQGLRSTISFDDGEGIYAFLSPSVGVSNVILGQGMKLNEIANFNDVRQQGNSSAQLEFEIGYNLHFGSENSSYTPYINSMMSIKSNNKVSLGNRIVVGNSMNVDVVMAKELQSKFGDYRIGGTINW